MAQQTSIHGASKLTLPSDLEIRVVRAFNAPRAVVYRHWTDPKSLPKWMGPAQYPMTESTMDVRPGGAYRWVWDLGDGATLVIYGTFTEVDPGRRLVTREKMEGYPGESHNIVLFEDKDGKTVVTMTMKYPTKEGRDGALASGMADGMEAGFVRLDAIVKAHA